MKKNIKRICSVVLFLAILSVIIYHENEIIKYKMPYGIVQYEGFYAQPEGSVDVLFMGTSHVYANIDPAYVYDESGILSYDLATGGIGIWGTYYSLEQALQYQKPKVVVIDVFGAIRGDFYNTTREIVDASYRIRDPKIKYQLLQCLCKGTGNSVFEMWLAFPWYHTLYNDINRYDFPEYRNVAYYGGENFSYLYPDDNIVTYKGTTTLSNIYIPENILDIDGINSEQKISYRALEYLNKIVRLAEEHNIEVCFVSAPFLQGMTKDQQMQVNYIKNVFCGENYCKFLDANLSNDEIGIIWESDLADQGHLNYLGAEKYSRWLGKKIKALYDLPDSRGTDRAASWDANLEWQNSICHPDNNDSGELQ